VKKINHIGIEVNNLEESGARFGRLLNAVANGTETVEDQRVRIMFFKMGEVSLELTQATAPDSPIARFIEKRGEGVHHLSFETDDIVAELVRLKNEGFQLLDEKPRTGAGGSLIAFLHPKSTGGILVEITQPGKH
jgi:methylmalonyl-CoA/ethylmalonyl-CoA epimerase